MKISITKPQLGKEEIKAVSDVLKSGWVVQGPKVAEFEKAVSHFTKAPYAIAVSSCTAGLHIALEILNIGPGDEVIVPAFTFVATANACEYVGAKPVFVDIDLETFNISPEKIKAKITKKTKAIMPVHLFGLSADMAKILKIAKKYQLKVIEDSACALGTKYQGKHVGLLGDLGVFSFHPRKTITTGEGGVIITNNQEYAKKAISLRDHGSELSDLKRHKGGIHTMPDINLLGHNYRMTDIQAAIGVEQMKKFKDIFRKRVKLAERYSKAFKNLPYLQSPKVPDYSNHAYQSYVLLVKEVAPNSRDEIAKILAKNEIATRQGTQNVPMLGLYRKKYGYKASDFSNSTYAAENTLTIPLYASMSGKEQDYVIKNLKENNE